MRQSRLAGFEAHLLRAPGPRKIPSEIDAWLRILADLHVLHSASGDGGFFKGRAQPFREPLGVVDRAEMDEEHAWLLGEHVTVDCGHLDAVGTQSTD
jgi:hypothetical protein